MASSTRARKEPTTRRRQSRLLQSFVSSSWESCQLNYFPSERKIAGKITIIHSFDVGRRSWASRWISRQMHSREMIIEITAVATAEKSNNTMHTMKRDQFYSHSFLSQLFSPAPIIYPVLKRCWIYVLQDKWMRAARFFPLFSSLDLCCLSHNAESRQDTILQWWAGITKMYNRLKSVRTFLFRIGFLLRLRLHMSSILRFFFDLIKALTDTRIASLQREWS